ncbi:MAG: phospholipid carrier-dependent glycosyltransferase [Myxococcales bacterium]|nr:phospholipid carrier-dependent glycosyltransferase [Myxococcales bacterium]
MIAEAVSRPSLVLVSIVVLAFVLRVVGLDFGLPLAEARPDEQTIAFQAMKLGRGDLNPHSFNYPSLFKYVTFALFGGDFAIGRALGRFGGQEDFLRSFFAADTEFRLLMRAFSAVMGTLCVALLARAPGTLWGSFFLAVSFLHVRDSHFGVTDITMVTLIVGAVLLAVELQRRGALAMAVGAGLVAGLATSTKYNAALLVVPLVAAAGSARGVGGLVLGAGGRGKLAAAALAAMIGGFLLGTPYALLDAEQFVTDFRYEMGHLAEGHYVDVGRGWVHHATATLPDAVGWPLYVLGASAILMSFFANFRLALVIFSFPLVYFVAIGRGQTAFYRYMLPVVPFLCIGAGAFFDAVNLRFGRVGAAIMAVLVASPSIWRSVEADRLFAAGDTREAMGAWIEENVPTNEVIVHAGAYTGAPMLQRNVPNQTREFVAKAGRADAGGFRKPDEMKWYRAETPMYDVLFLRKDGIDFASQLEAAEVMANPPPWLEIEASGLHFYSEVAPEIQALAATGYELVHEEIAALDPSHATFDQQDAFYMPTDGFGAFGRMGPNLRLYRRR